MKRPGGFDGSDLGPDFGSDLGAGLDAEFGAGRHPGRRPEAPAPPVPLVPAGPAAGEPTADPPAEHGGEEPAPPAPVERRAPRLPAVQGRGEGDRVRSAKRELKRAQRSVREREKREKRRFTAHLRRRRRYWLAGIGAVLALALFVVVGAFSPLMAVREVQIVGAAQVNAEELQAALASFDGVPLALVSERDVHRALEPFPLVQRYSIERIPPHTLLVRIEERDAVIAIGADGSYELRDPAGVLVATATELPAGVPLASAAAANPSTPAFAAAGRVIRDLPQDLREQLTGVTATSAQDVTFSLASGTQVVWGEASDTQRKAVVLRSMLSAVGAVSLIDVSAPDTPVFQ